MKKSRIFFPIFIVKTFFKYNPLFFILCIIEIIIFPLFNFVSVYFPKAFIEEIDIVNDFYEILILIIAYSLCLFFSGILSNLFSYYKTISSNLMINKLQVSVTKKCCDMDYYFLEDNKTREQIELIKDSSSLIDLFNIYVNIVVNSLTIFSISSLIVYVDFRLILMLLIIYVFRIFLSIIKYKMLNKNMLQESKNNKVGRYLDKCMYFNESCGKEIRVNSLHNWFKKKVINFREEMVGVQIKTLKIDTMIEIIDRIVYYFQMFLILLFLLNQYLKGIILLSEFIVYFNATISIINYLSLFSKNITVVKTKKFVINNYLTLHNLAKTKIQSNYNDEVKFKNIVFEFENVSFKYPNADDCVLQNINVKLVGSEKVAIVGNNGAGKSTFIKLLCKLYKPTSGIIKINGINIWEIENSEYYSIISALFQDFVIFPFSIYDNIVSDGKDYNLNKLLEYVGLYADIESFPEGIKTYISKIFSENGIELSGGQKQKIAIARALFKEGKIIILDEPLSSLDIESENNYYKNMIQTNSNAMMLIVSHRLAICKFSDRILVFDNGKIVGDGDHNKLLKSNKIYSELYNSQVKYYEKN